MTGPGLTTTLLAWLLVAPWPAAAQPAEWPGLYYEQCGKCHGDAHTLLDERAELRNGDLVGRRGGRDLRNFLGDHFGRRDKTALETIYMELLRVARGGGRFRQECAMCHESAEALARESLLLRDGELYGRYSGRRVEDFLTVHGRLDTGEDVDFFIEVLRRNMPEDR